MLSKKWSCLICRSYLIHYSLGAQVCRGCASFWRRTVSRNLHYFCQNNKQCKLEFVGERKKCKACRYDKMLSLEIVELEPSTKLGRKSYRKHVLSSSQMPSTSNSSPLFGVFNATKNELIDLSRQSYNTILNVIEQIRQNIFTILSKIINQTECLKKLDGTKLVRKSVFEVENVYRAYLTSVYFPDLDKDHVVISQKYIITTENLAFSVANINENCVQDVKNLSAPWLKKFKKLVFMFKKLEIGQEDVDFLIRFSVLNQAFKLDSDLTEAHRNDLITKWSSNLMESIPNTQIAIIRLSKLMLLSIDNEYISTQQKHVKTIVKFIISTRENNK